MERFRLKLEVLEQAEITSIESMLMTSQLNWAGHVFRLEDFNLAKTAIYGELFAGQRDRDASNELLGLPEILLWSLSHRPPQLVNGRCQENSLAACHSPGRLLY